MQTTFQSISVQARASALVVRPLAAVVVAGVLSLVLSGCDNDTPNAQSNTEPPVKELKLAEPKPESKPEPKIEFADAATLQKRVVEHTFTGQMGPVVVTEFYASGGVIHGAGYRARWTIDDNQLCLNYDDAPQDDCYHIHFDGQIMEWRRDGEIRGQGVLVAGNPNRL